jgi:hypothetical protein
MQLLWSFLLSLFWTRVNLLLENALTLQQLIIYQRSVKRPGLKDTPTAPRSPCQNPIAERVIGTLRRECLDHIIVLNEKHLRSVLGEYIDSYYNVSRTHMSLNKDSPVHRPVQNQGKIVSKPILGGLHHVYTRVA